MPKMACFTRMIGGFSVMPGSALRRGGGGGLGGGVIAMLDGGGGTGFRAGAFSCFFAGLAAAGRFAAGFFFAGSDFAFCFFFALPMSALGCRRERRLRISSTTDFVPRTTSSTCDRGRVILRRAIAMGVIFAACGKPAVAPAPSHRHLDADGWLAKNRARIDAFLDAQNGGVAVFDWDNTMMRNDIGDATFFWMLRHDKILQPPERDWSRTNRRLTKAARESLKACDAIAEPGKPLPTSRNAGCADAI